MEEAIASSITDSVKSLVKSILLIVFGCDGSTSKPTLSHDSASDRGAKRVNSSTTELRLDIVD